MRGGREQDGETRSNGGQSNRRPLARAARQRRGPGPYNDHHLIEGAKFDRDQRVERDTDAWWRAGPVADTHRSVAGAAAERSRVFDDGVLGSKGTMSTAPDAPSPPLPPPPPPPAPPPPAAAAALLPEEEGPRATVAEPLATRSGAPIESREDFPPPTEGRGMEFMADEEIGPSVRRRFDIFGGDRRL